MNHLIWRTVIAGLLGFGLAPLASAAVPASMMTAQQDKSYDFGGKLRLEGTVDYTVSNEDHTVTTTIATLRNDSTTTSSRSIHVRVFLTSEPVNGVFSYYPIAEYVLDPLGPSQSYTNLKGTVPVSIPPEGLYHAYVGVFEFEGGCRTLDFYCLDDFVPLPSRVLVSRDNISEYGQDPHTANAIGYYHAQFNHYFFTADVDEIGKLDSGQFAGWARTGRNFGIWSDEIDGVSGVCRFFSTSFGPKSSHFYTPFPDECATVKNNANWQYEGIVAYLALPAGDGSCGMGAPLYRLYNDGMDGAPNHRYTTSLAVRGKLIEEGWVAEGYGALGVIGCVPY